MQKPGSWFLLTKCLKNTCGRVTFQVKMQVFFKNFASKNQLPGLSVNETLIKNGLKNDFSGEITHFQKGLFFKQNP